MGRIIRSCVVLTLVFAGLCFASDINGKWKTKIPGPEGDMELMFNFIVKGDTLNGTVESPMGELPMTNGKLSGDEFSFDVNLGDMTIVHRCKVLADSISMKYTGMQGDTSIIFLKRPKKIK
jgi:hypothetical protein